MPRRLGWVAFPALWPSDLLFVATVNTLLLQVSCCKWGGGTSCLRSPEHSCCRVSPDPAHDAPCFTCNGFYLPCFVPAAPPTQAARWCWAKMQMPR